MIDRIAELLRRASLSSLDCVRLRAELLDKSLVVALDHARSAFAERRQDFNNARSQSSLQILDPGGCTDNSSLPHAAHAMATMSIILGAEACETLIDDRVQKRPDALDEVQRRILEARRGTRTEGGVMAENTTAHESISAARR